MKIHQLIRRKLSVIMIQLLLHLEPMFILLKRNNQLLCRLLLPNLREERIFTKSLRLHLLIGPVKIPRALLIRRVLCLVEKRKMSLIHLVRKLIIRLLLKIQDFLIQKLVQCLRTSIILRQVLCLQVVVIQKQQNK